MMGIAALGTAVGAFSKGYSEGERQASDLKDAELRREATRLGMRKTEQDMRKTDQDIELGGLQLDEAKTRKKAADRSRSIVESWIPFLNGDGDAPTTGAPASAAPVTASPTRAAGITPPGEAASTEAPTASAAPAGISAPGAAPAAAQGKQKMSYWDGVQKMFGQLTVANLSADPTKAGENIKTALDMSKRFTDQKTDGAIRALQTFNGQNADQVTGMLAQSGLQMPEGTRYEKRQVEMFPKSGIMVEDVVAISPDNSKTVSVIELMKQRLDPKDWLNMNNELGEKAATLAWRRESSDRAYNLDVQKLDAQKLHWKALEDQARAQTAASLARLGIEQDRYKFDRIQNTLSKAHGQAFDTVGFVRLSPEKLDLLSDTQRADYAKRLTQGNMVYSIYEMNFDLKKGAPSIGVAEANAAARFVAANRDKVQTDSTGQSFVEMDGKKVYVPAPPKAPPAAAAAQPGAPTAAAAQAAPQPGLTPPTMDQARAQFRASTQFLASANEAAARDQDIAQLKGSYQTALRAGRGAEANNILAQINQIKRDRYNLTPLGGVADPSKLTAQ